MQSSNRAVDALTKLRALRKVNKETGADTSRAQRFVLNGLSPVDQIWVIEKLEITQPTTPNTTEVSRG